MATGGIKMRNQISENIKKFRIVRGYTQSDLAALLSVSPQAVSRWENGQAFPDITLLPRLAKHLNVTIDEIMGSEEQRSECLKKEAFERKMANIDDESERVNNELRILEIDEELAHTELPYLINYFRSLMSIKLYKSFCFIPYSASHEYLYCYKSSSGMYSPKASIPHKRMRILKVFVFPFFLISIIS